jgi:tripartite-type tricarboxylate transporter receptor subunit TctC
MRIPVTLPIATLTSLICLIVAGPVNAQTYPNKSIHIVVPFPPGGVVDVAARLVSQRLAQVFGQAVVIENRTGASGTLGINAVTKADPDGYTLLITSPTLVSKMADDPSKDLVPVSMIATAPIILVASAASGFTTLKDVLAAAKAAPGAITYSSPSTGTINHLGGEWIAAAGGVKLLHVPYRGGAPAATAVATGEVQLGILALPAAISFVQAGKARYIGLLSKERPSFAKDLPTLADGGMPEVEAGLLVGLFGPPGTPEAVVSRLDTEVQKILTEPSIRDGLNGVGTDAHPLGPKPFAKRIQVDSERYGRVMEQTGVKFER